MAAKKGEWVRIHKIVLQPEDRAHSLPEDTKKVPLEMWDKGFLLNDSANIGEEVEIETYIGRKTSGTLVEVNPYYTHNFGKSVPELLYIGRQVRSLIEEVGDQND